MATATVTSKGQITIPAEVREKLGLRAGTRVRFLQLEDGVYEFVPVTGSVSDLRGMIRWSGDPISIEEMDDAIATAVTTGGDET